jgi:cytoskeletal protein RodZ
MAELGNTLSRARRARGISIEDAERDTHVSRRYLTALENEDFSIFPAPVYARGFLRTYSRYLGLNPEELMQVFPNGTLNADVNIAPLPTVSRPAAPMINVNWVVTGFVAIFLIGAALLLLRGGGNPNLTTPPNGSPINNTLASSQGTGAVQGASPSSADTPVQGKQIGPIRPGVLPDFVGADLASSKAVLRDNQINYVIVEYAASQPKGIVVKQSPNAGSEAKDGSTITLYVSAGASLQ